MSKVLCPQLTLGITGITNETQARKMKVEITCIVNHWGRFFLSLNMFHSLIARGGQPSSTVCMDFFNGFG